MLVRLTVKNYTKIVNKFFDCKASKKWTCKTPNGETEYKEYGSIRLNQVTTGWLCKATLDLKRER